ncbi:MAG: TIGR01212 family radical SAM protein [Bacteroidetes bacterium GWF2_43_63]|nr:MAG: TIGR01212 family radical SAM protein [Bacteroidetes bacterium GWE2_42_42]OFY54661.1 MAG: TIGR01212 family radical SAM protein [Bacteroidetes bacterium GWF2_43_63]HBG71831.1 TIGR01212 family radical SAM protein [Bacteroidales bacterium]HCB61414.1 TIGR01212 family radical SAM protein [Bacteroidales bacterium]HCY23351.1 TIGR01212 family radical SAM protein [Bacteroidales bacterium]
MHQKAFTLLSEYLKEKHGGRLQKVSVDAGFTCPNRDGSAGTGGCTYCDNSAFNPSYCSPAKSIRQQVLEGIEFHAKRYRRAQQFLVYFQPYSNTYAEVNKLRALFAEALNIEGVAGICVSTRPDCFCQETAELLAEIAENKVVMLELGVESIRDKTLQRINRGHDFAATEEAFELANSFNLFVTGHYIIGLPGESREEILSDASVLNKLPMNALKLHQLQIVRNTAMEKDYLDHPEDYLLFELPEYVDFIVSFAERLRPDLLIDRFAGEVPPSFLRAPDWGLVRYDQVLQMIEKKFIERNTVQGRACVI